MFSKKIIKFSGDLNHLISKHPESGFKKKLTIEIPNNYEVILVGVDGITEVVRNQYSFKLNEACQYLYFVKNNKKIIKTNWGTASRIITKNKLKKQISIGGYGSVEFRMVNAVKVLNYRMNNEEYVDEKILEEILLSKLPEIVSQAISKLGTIDDENLIDLQKKIKIESLKLLNHQGMLMGLEITDFVVEHVNVSIID